ncbi:MAG: hypothetical protein WC518_01690 [Patescibacteria group bacterium]
MADRKDNLFKIIVEEYLNSANPVGSSLVVEKYFPDLSSATIRNEMAELEEADLIYQPHTSAGRIPTIKGYQYYLDKFVGAGELNAKQRKNLDKLRSELKADQESIKVLAKNLAELSREAVLIGFGPQDVYYTGIANLFRQPEFYQQALVYSMSEIIDHLDEVMFKIFTKIDARAKILLGADNPFGEASAVILGQYRLKGQPGLVGILGPSRMNYANNLGLIDYTQQIIGSLK